MREVAAIVEPAIDINQITREILKEHIALQDDERNADAHERKSAAFRETAARRRVEIGRRLVDVRRVTKRGGWQPYLDKCGIEERTARNWMALAGWVEEKTETGTPVSDISTPTLADAGIDKRPRKRDEQPSPPHREPEPVASVPVGDVNDARAVEASLLVMVSNSLGTVARRWPGDIKRLADELRRFADKIERKANQ